MKKQIFFIGFLLTISLFLASPVNAILGVRQPDNNSAGIKVRPNDDAESLVQGVVSNFVALFFTFAAVAVLIMFIWGITSIILSGGDKEKLGGARRRITWALIGLVIMAFAFVIIQTLGQILGFNPLGDLSIPQLGAPSDLENRRISCENRKSSEFYWDKASQQCLKRQ